MKLTGNIDEALQGVESFIQYQPQYADFCRHRMRYRSDAEVIGRFYESGEILEIGAFPCFFTAMLKSLGYPATAVDLSPERCQPMIDLYGLAEKKCDIETEPLPFADGAFRYVLCNEVFEHLRVDPLFALSEMYRVLADDGTLMLTTPNLYAIQQIARFLTGRGFGDPVAEFMKLRTVGHMGHIREYSHAEIKRFLAFSNFEVKQVSYKHYYYPRTKRGILAKLLFTVLPARFRSYQVVLAKKAGLAMQFFPLP